MFKIPENIATIIIRYLYVFSSTNIVDILL